MRAALKPRIELEGRTALETVIPLATPYVVFVDPASSCNFKCNFCPTGHRDLIAETGRYQGIMRYDLFVKLVDDLVDFDAPLRVLRLYKDGEPLLNKYLANMVRYAKRSGRVERVDTTTNGVLLTPGRVDELLHAGIDRINVSVDGMDEDTYARVTGVRMTPQKLVENVRYLYRMSRGDPAHCEVVVKTIGDILTDDQRQEFFDLFGDICDRIFVENFAPCWPQFDVEGHTGVKITQGIYQQPIGGTDVCPYIFYGMSVNADGLVSSCFLDWGRKLIIGDARTETLRDIWGSDKMNALRVMHLEGRRQEHPVCGGCGQLTHCLPDSVDAHRVELLERVRSSLEVTA